MAKSSASGRIRLYVASDISSAPGILEYIIFSYHKSNKTDFVPFHSVITRVMR